MQHLVLKISAEQAQQRIDKALAALPEIATRSQAAKLLAMGAVRRENGRVVKPSHLVVEGEVFHVEAPVAATESLVPYDFPLDIIFEDQDLIVVNKPAGLVVHPACGHAQDTLVNALLHYTDDLSMGYNERRPGLVHRIDKGTSGLLVIAKHDEAQRLLADQFQKKTAHRLYRAIAFGPFRTAQGTLRSYLRRHPDDRKRMASVSSSDADIFLKAPSVGAYGGSVTNAGAGAGVSAGAVVGASASAASAGKHAVTHFSVTHVHASGLSLVELRLETGRTHQIRVHLSEAGHPIVGDAVYGGIKRAHNLKSIPLRHLIETMPRFALHAAELGFVHPRTKQRMVFAAGWPEDLLALIKLCKFPLEFEVSSYVSASDFKSSNKKLFGHADETNE